MSMRRPNMIRFNKWGAECLEVLSSSPSRLPSDGWFCQWLKLLVIAEDIYTSFSFDDENNIADLSETRVQFMLKSFEKRLDEWKKGLTPESNREF